MESKKIVSLQIHSNFSSYSSNDIIMYLEINKKDFIKLQSELKKEVNIKAKGKDDIGGKQIEDLIIKTLNIEIGSKVFSLYATSSSGRHFADNIDLSTKIVKSNIEDFVEIYNEYKKESDDKVVIPKVPKVSKIKR